MAKHSREEGWTQERHKAEVIVTEKVIQSAADKAAANATTAADIKSDLLEKLRESVAAWPGDGATEIRQHGKGQTLIYRLRDLTAAFADLTKDIPLSEGDKNAPIYELLRKLDEESAPHV